MNNARRRERGPRRGGAPRILDHREVHSGGLRIISGMLNLSPSPLVVLLVVALLVVVPLVVALLSGRALLVRVGGRLVAVCVEVGARPPTSAARAPLRSAEDRSSVTGRASSRAARLRPSEQAAARTSRATRRLSR